MKHRPLSQGTRVHVGSILITEKFGNMQISTTTTHGPYNVITVERADIDDLMTALNQHLGGGKGTCATTIGVTQVSDTLKISTTHSPTNTTLIAADPIADLTPALAK